MSKKVYLVSSVGKRVQMLLNTWVVLLCNVVYVLVSLFSAQILYVYFCTDQFRIWIIDDKSLDVAVVPFFFFIFPLFNITVLYVYRCFKIDYAKCA